MWAQATSKIQICIYIWMFPLCCPSSFSYLSAKKSFDAMCNAYIIVKMYLSTNKKVKKENEVPSVDNDLVSLTYSHVCCNLDRFFAICIILFLSVLRWRRWNIFISIPMLVVIVEVIIERERKWLKLPLMAGIGDEWGTKTTTAVLVISHL